MFFRAFLVWLVGVCDIAFEVLVGFGWVEIRGSGLIMLGNSGLKRGVSRSWGFRGFRVLGI